MSRFIHVIGQAICSSISPSLSMAFNVCVAANMADISPNFSFHCQWQTLRCVRTKAVHRRGYNISTRGGDIIFERCNRSIKWLCLCVCVCEPENPIQSLVKMCGSGGVSVCVSLRPRIGQDLCDSCTAHFRPRSDF